MKKFFIFFTLGLALSACTKETDKEPKSQGVFNPLHDLGSILSFSDDYDFMILSTFSTPASGWQPFDLNRGAANLRAGSDDGIHHGELFINSHELAFNGFNYQVMDTIKPSGFVGQHASFDFSSNGGSIPSFSVQKHVPMQTDLTFTGLVDGKIPTGGGNLSITWTPDSQFPQYGKAVFFFFYTSLNGNVISKNIVVEDSDGNLVIPSGFLADFEDDKRLDVMYLKGYHDLEVISDKKIDFQFIGHSWRPLTFEGYQPE